MLDTMPRMVFRFSVRPAGYARLFFYMNEIDAGVAKLSLVGAQGGRHNEPISLGLAGLLCPLPLPCLAKRDIGWGRDHQKYTARVAVQVTDEG